VDFALILINRLLEVETIDPLTAILLTRSLLLHLYLNNSYPQLILCCSARLYALAGLSFICFNVDAKIIRREDPISYSSFCHSECIAALNLNKITLDFFGI
jgi:hypothetical protein